MDDLAWLVAERPRPAELSPEVTDRARRDLLAHVATGAGAQNSPGRRRLQRVTRAASVLAIGAAAALAVSLVTFTATRVHHRSAAPIRAARPPQNQLLVRLANYIGSGPRPRGDATLVLRSQNYPHAPSTTGADLYTDSGKYFYAQSEAGLPAEIGQDANQGAGFMDRALAAARLAANGSLTTARRKMAIASFKPGRVPSPAQELRQLRQILVDKKLRPVPTPLQNLIAELRGGRIPRTQTDNEIWMNSLDAMEGGAGNPQVRAGVLRILATMSEVTVTSGQTDGQPSMTITARAPAEPPHYQEQLTINASTGLPIRFRGGTTGHAPGVTVTFKVTRVKVSAIAAGRF